MRKYLPLERETDPRIQNLRSIPLDDPSAVNDLGQVILFHRLERGITQAELAEKSGSTQPMIARIEKGRLESLPSPELLARIFAVLGFRVIIGIEPL